MSTRHMGPILYDPHKMGEQIKRLERLRDKLCKCDVFPTSTDINLTQKKAQAIYDELLKTRGALINVIDKTVTAYEIIRQNFSSADNGGMGGR